MAQNVLLTQKLTTFDTRVRKVEQYSRREHIEIKGLPVFTDQDIISIVRGRGLDVKVDPNTLITAHRAPTYQKLKMPPSIVIFTTRGKMAAWLKSGKYEKLESL